MQKLIEKIDFKKVRKILLWAVQLIVAICIGAMIYGWVTAGFFTLFFVFPANFLVGAIIIMAGFIVTVMPTRPNFKKTKLIDHTNYAELVMERREKKRKLGYDVMYIGMSIIIIAATVQFILSLVI